MTTVVIPFTGKDGQGFPLSAGGCARDEYMTGQGGYPKKRTEALEEQRGLPISYDKARRNADAAAINSDRIRLSRRFALMMDTKLRLEDSHA
jgi:hypothetical protein